MISAPIHAYAADAFLNRRDSYLHVDACREHRHATVCAVHYDLEVTERIGSVTVNLPDGTWYFRVSVYRHNGRLHMRELDGGEVVKLPGVQLQ